MNTKEKVIMDILCLQDKLKRIELREQMSLGKSPKEGFKYKKINKDEAIEVIDIDKLNKEHPEFIKYVEKYNIQEKDIDAALEYFIYYHSKDKRTLDDEFKYVYMFNDFE
jgi:hypothetical protein